MEKLIRKSLFSGYVMIEAKSGNNHIIKSTKVLFLAVSQFP
jgi:hypothetical protein